MRTKIFLFVALSCLLFNCKNKETKQALIHINPEFANYVSAYSSGLVSKVSPIKIILQGDYPLPTDENGVIQEEILSFSPKIEGKTYLEENNTIKFIPKDILPQGQAYTAKLKLSEFIPKIKDEFAEFPFQFQVKKQDFSAKLLGLESTTTSYPMMYNLNGKLYTNDVASSQEIENMLSVSYNGKAVPVQWQHAENQQEHSFSIPNVDAAAKDREIKIAWNGKPIGVDRTEKQTFNVPANEKFEITQIRTESKPEQFVAVNFSQPLDENQFMDGLVEIQRAQGNNDYDSNSSNYVKNIIVDGNELKIYTNKKIGGEYNLKLFPGIKSALNKTLQKEYTETLSLQHIFPEVKFVGTGNIIPETDGLYLPFEAIGLNAVRVEITKIYENNMHQFFQNNQYNSDNDLRMVGKKVFQKIISLQNQANFNSAESNTYQLELSKFIAPEPGAIYNVEFSFDKDFSAYPCDSLNTSKEFLTPLEKSPDNYVVDTEYNGDDYYYYDDYFYPDDYDWDERDNPCHASYYTNERNISRNILATNLGVIVKIGNNRKANITVSNLLSAKPEAGVEVTAFDLQNQEVGKGSTDKDGFAEFDLNRKPFLIKAEKGKNKAYIRVDDGSSLSLSNFAVDGKDMKNGMAGYIYGERGVWRPGDSIHLTFVLNQKFVKIPEGQPAVLEFKNPEGQIMSRQVNNNPMNGFYTFGLQTYQGARTGNWNAEITLGGMKFYKTLKIETIKPNRLKINTKFPDGVLNQENATNYQLNAKWLSGANANNLAAKVVATVSSIPTKFETFPNFTFDDPSREFSAEEQTIFDGSLSAEGSANIPTKISTEMLPPGMLQMGLFTKVFEPGGDFSSKYETKKYAPYKKYVGLNLPVKDEGWRMLETDKTYEIPVATVDQDGKPTSSENVEVKIYRLENSWWYNANNNLAYYVSREYENLYSEQTIATKNGRGSFELKVPEDEWGNYFIRVCDSESGHCSGERIWIDWPNWRSRGGIPSEGASILNFKTDKEKYKVGETATITIPSSLKGRALVSLENGVGVLHKKWEKSKDGTTSVKIKITEEMAPNCYVNIALLQPHEQTVNDMPIRMYGVVPLFVENPENHLHPVVSAPKEISPKADYQVKVSEKNGKEMTYTLAVVDEGLLDITNFKTPDIYGHFNQKQALGVKTWDLYNYVLGAYGGRIESVFAIGGDMAMQAQNKEKINRFEPVVKFIGPFTLKKGETQAHKLKMDNYVGSVKVMVVAGNGEAFGSTESNMFVRQPLMALTTLPRVLNPGDEVQMPVTIFAMDKKIKNVRIAVESNDYLMLNDENNKALQFTETGDQIVNFRFKVPEKIGKAKVKVRATSGSYTADQEIELEVRSPNPSITRTTGNEVIKNQVYQVEYAPFGISGTNLIQLQLSALPEMRLNERLRYLIQYPHGCIEQTVSSVFPQLYLNDLTELSKEQQDKVEDNIKKGLQRLKRFQLSGGGMSYWLGSRGANDWGSSYALHFILKAEAKGYKIPVGLKSNLINYQKREARYWNYYGDKTGWQDQMQAYRLYTLALAGSADFALMNRLKEKDLKPSVKWQLVEAYELAGQGEIAKKMMLNTPTKVSTYEYNRYTFGSTLRDEAIILSALNVTDQRQKGNLVMKDIASQLSKDTWYSTQTTAFALMAVSEFVHGSSNAKGIDAELVTNGKVQKVSSQKPVITMELPVREGKLNVKNLGGNYLFAAVINTGTPMEIVTQKSEKSLGINIKYYDLDNQPIDVSNLKQGADFKSVARISHPGVLGAYHELALTQMFPSGWEIVNTRVNDQVTRFDNVGLDFQDFRDDRVDSYFDLQPNKYIEITTLLNATYAGTFALPAAYCEAMYNNEISAIEPGKRVRVVR